MTRLCTRRTRRRAWTPTRRGWSPAPHGSNTQSQQLDKAEDAYLQLLNRFDSDFTADDNRQVMRDARLTLSTINVQQNRLKSAEQWLLQVLDEFPDDAGALNDLGYLWVDQNEHLKRSLAMVQEAVKVEPENIAYRDSLGWALFRLGRYEEAVQELRLAAASQPVDGVILDHLGDALLKANQPDQALETWRQAVQAFQTADQPHESRRRRRRSMHSTKRPRPATLTCSRPVLSVSVWVQIAMAAITGHGEEHSRHNGTARSLG